MTTLRKINAGLAALLGIGVIAAVVWLKPMSDIGAGYVAKQVCSCVFIGQRTFDECRLDQDPDMDRIDAELLEDLDGVHAELFPLSAADAYYHPGSGCTLE